MNDLIVYRVNEYQPLSTLINFINLHQPFFSIPTTAFPFFSIFAADIRE